MYNVRSKVWLYHGAEAAWHFTTIPKKQSDLISERFEGVKRGWGSLPVTVTIGKTTWKTSIFPDKKAGAYILPLKAKVRKEEGITVGKSIGFSVEIMV